MSSYETDHVSGINTEIQGPSEYDMREMQMLSGVYPETVTGKYFGGVQFHIPVKEVNPKRKSDSTKSISAKEASKERRNQRAAKQDCEKVCADSWRTYNVKNSVKVRE